MASCYLARFLLICAVAVAELSPSGDVRVCADDVVEILCNISRSANTLTWLVTPPGNQISQGSFFDSSNLPEIKQPVPHASPGVNITIQNVTTTSIISSLTVDTSLYEITSDPIRVRCIGADGEANIRNLGLPNMDMLHCVTTGDNQVNLSWSLTLADDFTIASVKQYSLILTPSPPSLTSPLITNTTSTTLTLLRDINITVDITAHTCVGNITTRHNISTSICVSSPITTVIDKTTTTVISAPDQTKHTTSIRATMKPTASASLTVVLPLVNGLVLVIVVVLNIAVCVALALCLARKLQVHGKVQHCSSCKASITKEMIPKQVRSERSVQEEPLYEDISKNEKASDNAVVVLMEQNAAYGTTMPK